MAKAHYLARSLAAIEGVTLRYSGEFFHEFVTDLPKQDEILAALEHAADVSAGVLRRSARTVRMLSTVASSSGGPSRSLRRSV